MRKVSLLVAGLFFMGLNLLQAQDDDMPSPHATASNTVNGVEVKIDYHQPGVKGRKIYDGLVPYGAVWRTGANNATKFTVSENILFEGKELKKGSYALFTIPQADSWTIILNSEADQWGAYNYDPDKDVLRVNVKPYKINDSVERMTFTISDKGKINYAWEHVGFTASVKKK